MQTISVVLLSQDNYYLGPLGQLPERPLGDKDFITNLSRGKRVLMSKNTYKDMPKSILDNCIPVFEGEYDINFGIDTFKRASDMFIIIRSKSSLGGGKAFRSTCLDEYNQIMNINGIEMYFKKHAK